MQLPLETEGCQQQQQVANQNREAILVFIDVFLQLSWRQYSLDRVLDRVLRIRHAFLKWGIWGTTLPRAEISGILVMIRRSSAMAGGTTYWFP